LNSTLLDNQYAESLGALCVVYGRRRVGKTRLITHWLANRDIPGFYWLATDSAPGALLRSLSQALYRQLHGQAPADPGFTYYDWDELLRELARLAAVSVRNRSLSWTNSPTPWTLTRTWPSNSRPPGTIN
jgi:uncharacterized protein